MPRVSLKELFLSMTLVALGLATFVIAIKTRRGDPSLILWHGSGALVGLGVFAPFKRYWTGVTLGVVFQFLFLWWIYARTF